MSFSALVKSRLATLGLGQKDLAKAAQVTDSYISQLLTRRKAPPAPDRTDIYPRMEAFLRLKPGELGRLAEAERAEEIKRRLGQVPEPLFQEFRDLVLRKCVASRRESVRAVFEGRPFGTLERLITQTMLVVVQRIARRELDRQSWMRLATLLGGRSHEEMRVIVLDFLDADVFDVSKESCAAFIEPLVESWDVDLNSLRLDIVLHRGLVADPHRSFSFVESTPAEDSGHETGFAAFLDDPQLSDGVTEQEIELLRRQRFGGKRPNKLYYYRALQNLRDPLHFREK